jgi:hypothetical protein
MSVLLHNETFYKRDMSKSREDNINMDLEDIGCENVYWISSWQGSLVAIMNTVMKVWVSWKGNS